MGLTGSLPGGLPPLFPPAVAVELGRDADADAPLFPGEDAAIARAVDRRPAEFRMGRAAARRALARLGVPPGPIPAAADRAPIWPAGVAGTITHTDGLCAAAVARRETTPSLGLDIERRRPLDARVRDAICTPEEQARHADDERPWDLLTFAAKEAFYKAWYPLTATFLDFHEVTLRLHADGAFTVEPGRGAVTQDDLAPYAGQWAYDDDFVYAAAWIRSARPDPAGSAPTSG